MARSLKHESIVRPYQNLYKIFSGFRSWLMQISYFLCLHNFSISSNDSSPEYTGPLYSLPNVMKTGDGAGNSGSSQYESSGLMIIESGWI